LSGLLPPKIRKKIISILCKKGKSLTEYKKKLKKKEGVDLLKNEKCFVR
jgi:hypothetical protein